MLLGLVIGNSRLRYGILDAGRVVEAGALFWEEYGARHAEVLEAAERHGVSGTVAGSVRDDWLETVEKRLPASLLPVGVARRDFRIPIGNLYDRPEDVGADRLLGCVAALQRSGGRGALVVDFGTAIALSVVTPTGDFLGGTIAAGAGALLRGLGAAAPRLPRLRAPSFEPPARPAFIATSTVDALHNGAYWQVVGGVRALLAGTLAELPFRPRIVATGGGAEAVLGDVPEVDEMAPDLVLEGLAHAACAEWELPRGGAEGGRSASDEPAGGRGASLGEEACR